MNLTRGRAWKSLLSVCEPRLFGVRPGPCTPSHQRRSISRQVLIHLAGDASQKDRSNPSRRRHIRRRGIRSFPNSSHSLEYKPDVVAPSFVIELEVPELRPIFWEVAGKVRYHCDPFLRRPKEYVAKTRDSAGSGPGVVPGTAPDRTLAWRSAQTESQLLTHLIQDYDDR